MRLRKKMFSLALLIAASLPWAHGAFAAEGDAYFSVSPESAHSLMEQAIAGAASSIDVNVYMLTSRNITRALADKAAAGVKVTVLMEGDANQATLLQPVKNVLDDFSRDLKARAPRTGRFYVLSGQGGQVARRYVFDHAKYLVIDRKSVLVSSENFTGSAFGNRAVVGGTRGWQLALENSALAASLGAVFRRDADPRSPDVVAYENARFEVKDPGGPLPPQPPRGVQQFPMRQGHVEEASLCASPGSLDCILAFIQSARSELVVEQLSMPLYWLVPGGKEKIINPIVQAYVDAAKRGVRVRVLLNDDAAFGDDSGTDPDFKNSATVAWLQAQAASGKDPVPLEAAIFNFKAVEVNYLHNKGMVADGRRVFVGSINGTRNSVENNREIALAVSSPDAANYFGGVFDLDWSLR